MAYTLMANEIGKYNGVNFTINNTSCQFTKVGTKLSLVITIELDTTTFNPDNGKATIEDDSNVITIESNKEVANGLPKILLSAKSAKDVSLELSIPLKGVKHTTGN